jgi:hypothetical protein
MFALPEPSERGENRGTELDSGDSGRLARMSSADVPACGFLTIKQCSITPGDGAA